MEILLKKVYFVFFCTSQIEFQLGFGPSNFLPVQLDTSVILLSSLCFLPEFMNSLFLPEFLKKLWLILADFSEMWVLYYVQVQQATLLPRLHQHDWHLVPWKKINIAGETVVPLKQVGILLVYIGGIKVLSVLFEILWFELGGKWLIKCALLNYLPKSRVDSLSRILFFEIEVKFQK